MQAREGRASGAALDEALPDNECDFAVLGPLVVRGPEGRVAVGGLKEQTVLAVLLAQANQVVSASNLIEGIWGEHPPRTAAKTLQGYVLRLRQALEPDRPAGAAPVHLVTAGDGYQLRVPPAHLDAGRFEQLVNNAARQRSGGNWSGSAASLRTALALWRGEPYGAFLDAPVCMLESERLAALYQTAREDCIEADLTADRAAAVVPQLERLVGDNPFRERLWGLLILALYRCGRQAEALRAYQRARKTLVEEMGIEPGPELRRLEAAVLAQDPVLDETPDRGSAAPGGVGLPVGLASVGPSFVGRRRELDELKGALQRAETGHGGLIAVAGPEGVGKTRLVAELARLADAEGSPVCYARCSADASSPLEIIRQLLTNRGLSPADVADFDGKLLRTDPLHRLAEFLAGWAVAKPTVVIVDDVHESDLAAELVTKLGSACQQLPVLVVAVARSDSPLFPAEKRTIQLGGLTLDEVVTLGSLYSPEEWSVADAEDVLRVSGGLPLAVHEMVSDLARARGGARLVEVVEQAGQARKGLAAVQAGIAERVVSLQEVEERRRAHLRSVEPLEPDARPEGPVVCPYKGLARFESEDAPYFFGRERLVATLTARLVGASLLIVTGPSGSGKSSVVRAGLLSALAQGVLPGSDSWQLITLSPGAHPVAELSRRLRSAEKNPRRRIVFVDQFEELFTARDESERAAFVSRLLALSSDEPPTTVVLAVRSDELGRCAAYPELAERIAGNDVLIGPMSDRELARAVQGPAERAHLKLEAGLAKVVIADVADRPGALPLLSTALLETWERRQGTVLTLAGYRDAGGVQGAVARLAESAYAGLTPLQQRAARRVLLHLADIDPGRPADIRRRVAISEVLPEGDADTAVALDVLVGRRLLSIGDGTVEVTHEALLREWPRLRDWLEADVEGRRLHHNLASQAAQWEQSGHHPSELLRGPRLSAAVEWAEAHADDLNARESAFLSESSAMVEQEAVEARRRADEQLRINQRLRRRLALLTAVAVVAVAAGGVALTQRSRAEAAARKADALRLATASVALPADQLNQALLMARQAWQLNDSTETRSAVLTLLLRSPRLSHFLPSLGGGVDAVDVSNDGTTVAVASADNDVRLFDPQTGRLLSTFAIPETAHILRVLVSPDGRTIGTIGGDATLRLWDRHGHALGPPLSTAPPGTTLNQPVPSGGFVSQAAFSPDGRELATVDLYGHGLVWNVASERAVADLPLVNLPAQKVDVTFSPDGTRLAVAASPSIVVDTRTMQTAFVVPGANQLAGDSSVAFSPDGRLLATARGSEIQLWDLVTGRPARAPLHTDATLDQIRFSPDGQLLAAGTDHGTTLLWNTHTFDPSGAALVGQQGPINRIAFVSGTTLLMTATGSSVAVWDTATGQPLGAALPATSPPGGVAITSVAYSPDAKVAAAAGADGTVWEWHLSAGKPTGPPVALQHNSGSLITALRFSPDGRRLAAGTNEGSILIFDPEAAAPGRLSLQAGGSGVTSLAFARRSGLLAAGTADGRVLLLTPRSWSIHRVIFSHQSGAVTALAFSPDGALLVSGGDDGYLLLDEVRRSRTIDLAIRTSEKVTGVAYRPDGRLIAAGYSDGVAVLVQPPEGARSTPLSASSGVVNAVAFSADGRLLAIGTADGTLSLWDARTYQRLAPSLAEPTAQLTALSFSPTTQQLLSGSSNGTAALWDVDPRGWATRLCTLAGRALTRQEWSQLLPGRRYHPSCNGALK